MSNATLTTQTPAVAATSAKHYNAKKDMTQDPNLVCIKAPTLIIKEKYPNTNTTNATTTNVSSWQKTNTTTKMYTSKSENLLPILMQQIDTELDKLDKPRTNGAASLSSEENMCDKNFLIIDELINCVKQKNPRMPAHEPYSSATYVKSNSHTQSATQSTIEHQKQTMRQEYAAQNKYSKNIGCYDESYSAMNSGKYASNPALVNMMVAPNGTMQFNMMDEKKAAKKK